METSKRAREETENVGELLDGLNFTSAGNVRVDEALFKKLRGETETIPVVRSNPFREVPEFLNVINSEPVSLDFLKKCSEKFQKDADAVKMAEMIGNLPLEWLALKRSEMKEDDWEYNIKTEQTPRVTDQYHSGRCWMFSAMNQLRYPMIEKFKLDDKFEFSGAYLFFFDKIERANFFLESMWSLREKELDDRYVKIFTDAGQYMSDGGYFQYFLNLVRKYGLVPKTTYVDSYNCLTSDDMNEILQTVLNHMTLEIRNNDWSRRQFERKLKVWNSTIYNLMSRFMGEPPSPDKEFVWKYKNVLGDYKKLVTTPKLFYQRHIPHEHDTKITLIHDPRNSDNYYKTHLIEYGTNMVSGLPANFLNVPLDVMKKAIRESLRCNTAVWFANDVGKCLDSEHNTLDTKRFDYQSVLGTQTTFSKSDMLRVCTSVPSHAMVLCGVDVDETDPENPIYHKWRVENSWGINVEMEWAQDHGYWKMTDDHFNQYTYMAVVDLKFLDEETAQKIVANQGETVVYKPWDAFGTVARGACKHCRSSKINKYKK